MDPLDIFSIRDLRERSGKLLKDAENGRLVPIKNSSVEAKELERWPVGSFSTSDQEKVPCPPSP